MCGSDRGNCFLTFLPKGLFKSHKKVGVFLHLIFLHISNNDNKNVMKSKNPKHFSTYGNKTSNMQENAPFLIQIVCFHELSMILMRTVPPVVRWSAARAVEFATKALDHLRRAAAAAAS